MAIFSRAIAAIGATSGGVVTTPLPAGTSVIPSSGATLVRANTVQLAAGASAVDNYYVGYDIILSKVLSNGKTYKQQKRIIAYQGSTKVAVIDGIWDEGYEPATTDTYQIVLSYPDQRVTINPVMQTLDYVTSDRYGRNLDVNKDILLSSWMTTARKCDAQSDVSVRQTGAAAIEVDAVYRLTHGTRIVFEGKVRSVDGKYVNFTEVLGKLTNKWNSWKTFTAGDIIYTSTNKFYQITADMTLPTEPNDAGGTNRNLITGLSLNKISGGGNATMYLDITNNPIVKLNDAGEEISGYSLYDSDSIDYWRRLGWDEHSQSWVTLHQTNFTIDTSTPMFDNINMMLEHFNGIFSYSQGRYSLSLEEIESEYVEIDEDDIIGRISFEDSGNKSSYNSVTVSYSDPANNYEGRNISLFSQSYLKQDRNVPKKGNITVTGITNYYNVRLLADSYLKRSRFNATIGLTLFPEFISLITGNVIAITYKRYNWVSKPFRIDTLTINPDGTIGIVANEYHESFYALTNMNKTADVGSRSPISYTPITTPTSLRATNTVTNNELKDGILLTWVNASNLSASTRTEIQASDTSSGDLTVTNITSNVLTTAVPHGLSVGSMISIPVAGYGLVTERTYFVKTTPSATTLTLSTELGGAIETIINASGITFALSTFTVVGEVSYPESSFLHTFPNITNDTVKYYRIRYKTEK